MNKTGSLADNPLLLAWLPIIATGKPATAGLTSLHRYVGPRGNPNKPGIGYLP